MNSLPMYVEHLVIRNFVFFPKNVQQWQNSPQAEFKNSVVQMIFFIVISINTIGILKQETRILLKQRMSHNQNLVRFLYLTRIVLHLIHLQQNSAQNSVFPTEFSQNSVRILYRTRIVLLRVHLSLQYNQNSAQNSVFPTEFSQNSVRILYHTRILLVYVHPLLNQIKILLIILQ